LAPYSGPLRPSSGINQLIVLIHAEHAVGAEALHGEGTGHADLLFVVVGLVVEVFKLGLGGDGLVDLLLPGDAGLPPCTPSPRRVNWCGNVLTVFV
jgi:hypothetical protein